MRTSFVKNGLVVGVILLFIGVAIQPVIGLSNNDDTTPPVTTHTLDPPEPDGENGWYVSDVIVTLNATDDISGVKEISYQIDGGSVVTVLGEVAIFFVTFDSLMHTIKYWAVDNVGNTEPENTINFKQDQTPPDTAELTYEITGGNQWQGYDFLFTMTATDATSTMERVEFRFNDELQETVTGPGPTYQWELTYWSGLHVIISATAFDNAGNNATDETGIYKQKNYNQPKINQQSLTLLLSRLFDRFSLLEVIILRAMNLLK